MGGHSDKAPNGPMSVVPGKASASEPGRTRWVLPASPGPSLSFTFWLRKRRPGKRCHATKPEADGPGLDWPLNDCGGLLPRGHSHIVSADGAHAAVSGNAAPPEKVSACGERNPCVPELKQIFGTTMVLPWTEPEGHGALENQPHLAFIHALHAPGGGEWR